MSVYIKGMEMPKNCWDCPFWNTEPCPCKGYSTALEHTTDRHQNCPLVHVSDHGRLIDADALTMVFGLDEHFSVLEAMYLMSLIADAPTIIPADFAEDTNVPTKTADKEAGE